MWRNARPSCTMEYVLGGSSRLMPLEHGLRRCRYAVDLVLPQTVGGGGGRDTGDSACEVGSDEHIWTGPNYKLSRSATVTAAATAATRTARA
jgi:hypothetical protein